MGAATETAADASGNPSDKNEAPIPEIVPPETAEALRKAGIESPEAAKALMVAISSQVSRSPFPSPDMLRAYDDYKPGMGADVVQWIKDQTHHRQTLERQKTSGSESRLNVAQRNALIVALAGLTAATVISWWNTVAAVVVAIVTIGGPSTAAILARKWDPTKKPPAD